MPYYGERSEGRLATVKEELQQVCRAVIQYYDHTVIRGYSGETEQNDIFSRGFSTKEFPDSKHNVNPSEAVDLAPYPIDWKDINRFILLAGMMMQAGFLMGIPIRWGGDWNRNMDMKDQKFMDWGHFELV